MICPSCTFHTHAHTYMQVNVGLRSYVGPGNTGMLPIAQRVDNRPAFMLERATSTQDRINWHVAQTKSAAIETQAR